MRFMVIVKASPESEAGEMPSADLLAAMGAYNEELVKAGVMLAGEGLHPSAEGVRVQFSGKDRTVIDGPFAETKELIAGFWIFKVQSLQEAIDWVKRCPNRWSATVKSRSASSSSSRSSASPLPLNCASRKNACGRRCPANRETDCRRPDHENHSLPDLQR